MSARAPASIHRLWDDINDAVPAAVLSGIVGDEHHSFGYHLARRDLPHDDYSVALPRDREGASDCASALDITLPPKLMITVTRRLLRAARAKDPRLHALREFCGTTNGTVTHPYDLSDHQNGPLGSWDSSHLWHVHLSFYRAYADDYDALAPIANVIGSGTDPGPGPDPDPDQTEATMTPHELARIRHMIDARADATDRKIDALLRLVRSDGNGHHTAAAVQHHPAVQIHHPHPNAVG